jgi:hypothetical protein
LQPVIWVWIGTVIEPIASAEWAKVRRAIDEGVPPKLGNNLKPDCRAGFVPLLAYGEPWICVSGYKP